MNYHDIVKDDMLNGDGLRVTLFVAGCNHYCYNCQNPQTWDKDSGIEFDALALEELYQALSPDYIAGLTISGGDPLFPLNIDTVTYICSAMKYCHPTKTIWLYTGYQFEDKKDLELMQYIDVIVDGEFKEELKDENFHWAGSTNQRVIDVKKSLKEGKVILHNDRKTS